MTSMIKVDEIQNSAGTTTLAKFENGQLTGALSPATGFRNRIINGDMRIDQRNAGAAVTVNGYTVDRFSIFNNTDGAFSIQQDSSAPNGFINSLKATATTADGTLTTTQQLVITQSIEGLNVSDLGWGTANAQPITLSFWVRSSLTGTFGGSLRSSGGARSYPFTYNISVADTWEQKSITVSGDTTGTWLTTNGIGIQIGFSLGAGPDRSGTAGAWAGANYTSATGAVSVIGTLNATWYITGVQLEKGTVATPFEFRSIGQELALCQRYYETNLGTGYPTTWAAGAQSYARCGVQFSVNKRATPTMVFYNGTTGIAGTARFWNNTVEGDSALANTIVGTTGFTTEPNNATVFSVRAFWRMFYAASAEL